MLDFQKLANTSPAVAKGLSEIVCSSLIDPNLSPDVTLECFDNYQKLGIRNSNFYSNFYIFEKINYFSLYQPLEPSFLYFQKDFISYYDDIINTAINNKSLLTAINSQTSEVFLSIYPEVGMKYLEHYKDYYQIPEHPLLSSYLSFYELTKDVRKLDLQKISTFWNKHYEKFSFDEVSIEGGNINSHEFYLAYIKLLKNHISRIIFSHFILYPEEQKNWNNYIPSYFTFFKWLSSSQFIFLHHYFTDEHLLSLETLKNQRYYNSYVKEIFMHNFDIKNNDIHSYFTYLEKLIDKNINWDLLFSTVEGGLTDNTNLKVILPKNLSTILNDVIHIAETDMVYTNEQFISDIQNLQQKWQYYKLEFILENKGENNKFKI